MMKVECGWCGVDLGWRQGPDGQVTHGICEPCQTKQLESIRRPFSATQKAVAAAVLVGWMLLSGWAGERDRQDAEAYQPVKAEIVASALVWAVTK